MKQQEEPAHHRSVQFTHHRCSNTMYAIIGFPTKHHPHDDELEDTKVLSVLGMSLAPRGGKVVCTIQEGNLKGVGIALCSYSDIFDRRQGRDLAYLRASKALELCKTLDVHETFNPVSVTVEPRKQ